MKKKLFVAISAIVCLLASVFGLTACAFEDYSKLSVKDVTLAVNEVKQIEVVFEGSFDNKDVTYTFEGENIAIENGFAAGLVADTVTTVTAKAGGKETTFKVKVGSETAEADFSVNDIELKAGAKRIIVINAPVAVQRNVTFRYEGNNIRIAKNDAGASYVEGLVAGTTTTVTAISNKSVVKFSVTVSEEFAATVTIENMTMNVGETKTIVPVFSDETKAEELSYSLNGNSVTVENGVITAVKEGTTEVTAYSEHYSVKFTVTVTVPFTVENAETFEGYFMTVKPTFNGEATQVTYTSDSENIEIDGYNVKGIAKGNATVTATDGTYTTTFTVKVKDSSEATDEGKARALNVEDDRLNAVKDGLKNFEHDEGELVLFAGDSFMDERWFFVDFYSASRYGAKNAYTVGISSSRASGWKYMMQNFYKYQPKAIVLHIGTNDLFDGGLTKDVILKNLDTLLSMSNENMPNTHIYWWTIEQRIGQENYNPIIKEINAAMVKYAADKEWLDVIDTYSGLSDGNGNPIQSLYGSNGQSGNDSVHPACPAGYDKLTKLTFDAGLNITVNSKAGKVADWSTEQTQNLAASSKSIPLTDGKFLFRTELTIVSSGNNAHVSFAFNNDSNERFLIWDSDSNKIFNYGGACGGNYQSGSVDTLDAAAGNKKVTVEILFDGETAYFFVDGKLERVFTKAPITSGIVIGTEATAAKFENTVVYAEANNGLTATNEKLADSQITALFDSGKQGAVVSNNTALPDKSSKALLDVGGYHTIGESGYTLDNLARNEAKRDNWIFINGASNYSGDFIAKFDFERTANDAGNSFLGFTFSAVGQHEVWKQYHLFYQRNNNGTFKIHSSYGSLSQNPNYDNISADSKEMTFYLVKQGNTVKQIIYIKDTYVVSTNTFEGALELWVNIEGMTGVISNVSLSKNADEITDFLNKLTCATEGHAWDDGVVTVQPTDDTPGTKVYTCTRCGEKKTETVYACRHVYDANWQWTGETASLTLVCTKDSSHTLSTSEVTYEKKESEGKWGIMATATLGGTNYTNFKSYEAIYSNLVIASSETVDGARHFVNTNGKFYFSATVNVTGAATENNAHLQFGKDRHQLRFLVWAPNNEEDLALYNFYYCKTANGLVDVVDGAATFTVEVTANGSTAWFKVNGKVVATINENSEIKEWTDLLVGGTSANWSFSHVIYESENGAHYKETPDNAEEYGKVNAGEKVALSSINAEYEGAQYAEVTIYGNNFNSALMNIGTSLVITDTAGNSVYGFGSWEFLHMGWLLAWQDVTQDNASHNDEMWQWMTDLKPFPFTAFCDYTLGLKISVAIYGGKTYAFYSVDGGANWTMFASNSGANLNSKGVVPAKIGYIYAGHDAYYKDLSASKTVPENITAIINKEFESQSYGGSGSVYTAIDFNPNGYVEGDYVVSFNVENANVDNWLVYTAYDVDGNYGKNSEWGGTWSVFHQSGTVKDNYASLYTGTLSDKRFAMTANYTVTIVRYQGTMYTIIRTEAGMTYAKAAIADSVKKMAFGGFNSAKSTATLTNKTLSQNVSDITAALNGII
ncbi:MAG: SGNH/GDSL hydrolase family protein [Clostridia bacterium]|nr:SGNH/GDSL hydrolase family protein [Clostridia bacterium]